MGQPPNMPLAVEDLPRHVTHPGAPRRWKPDRPGDFAAPGDVPRGGSFGTPGPDSGYALRILRDRPLPGSEHQRKDVTPAVAAVMTARAAALGRAPMPADVEVAVAFLALDAAGLERLRGIAHDHARLRSLVASIPTKALAAARLSA